MVPKLSVSDYREMVKRGHSRPPALLPATDALEIRLELTPPPSVNRLTANRRDGGRCKTSEYRRWCRIVAREILAQRPGSISGWVELDFCFPRRRNKNGEISGVKRDASNLIKASEDALVRNGVIEDDSKVWRGAYSWQTESDRMIVTVRQADIDR